MVLPFYRNYILELCDEDTTVLNPQIILHSDTVRFRNFLKELKNSTLIGIDCETTAFKFKLDQSFTLIANGALDPFQADLRLLQVGLDSKEVLIIDFGGVHKTIPTKEESLLLREFFMILKERFANPEVQILGHNLKFDLTVLNTKLGGNLFLTKLRDTMLMSQIYWSGVGVKKVGKSEDRSQRGAKGFHSLGKLAERLDIEIDKHEQLSDWSLPLLSNSQLNYAAKDVLVLFPIYQKLYEAIIHEGLGYSVLAELEALAAFVSMEFNGYPVCKETLLDYLEKYEVVSAECVAIWESYAGDLSIQKTDKDIVPFFSKTLGIEINKCAKEDLAPLNHPCANALLEYRSLKKSIDYLKSVLKKIETSEQANLGTRIRTRFTQIATNWRSSCTGNVTGTSFTTGKKQRTELPLGINLQQIPNLSSSQKAKGLPNIRDVFKAPEGYKIIIADLSQAHSRIAAQIFRDSTQLAIYNEGKDGHLLMASKLLEMEGIKMSFEEVTNIYKEAKRKDPKYLTDLENKILYKRQEGKTGFYSFLNQAGAATMQMSFKQNGMSVTLEYAETLKMALRDVYEGLYKGITQYLRKVNTPPEQGGIEYNFSRFTDITGTPIEGDYGVIYGAECLLYKGNRSRNYCMKYKGKYEYIDKKTGVKKTETTYQVAFTDAISFMWLSTEATIIKKALGDLYIEFNKEENKKWGARLINFVHDQIDVEVKEEYAPEVATLVGSVIKKNMEVFIDAIPVEEADVDYLKWIGQSMGDLH